jgi:hypothetical protein
MPAIRPRADAMIGAARQPAAKFARPATSWGALRGGRAGLFQGGRTGSDVHHLSTSSTEVRRQQQQQEQREDERCTLEEISNDDDLRATTTSAGRRQAIFAAAAAIAAIGGAPPSAANAAEAAAAPAASSSPPLPLEPFLDNDWSISYPRGYVYREDLSAPPPRDPTRGPGGPAPARSPLRARFDAPTLATTGAPAALLSVIVRQAQTLRPTLMQVSDVSAFGPPEEAAKLLLPRGARLVSAAEATETSPPRETPLGPVDIPPVSYYYYEFIAPGGQERAVLAAAASRGKIYVAGGSAPTGDAGGWESQRGALAAAVRSFRLRNQTAEALELVQVQQQKQKQKKA